MDQNGHAENGDTGADDAQPEALANGVHADDDDEDAAAFGKKKKKSSKSKRGELTWHQTAWQLH